MSLDSTGQPKKGVTFVTDAIEKEKSPVASPKAANPGALSPLKDRADSATDEGKKNAAVDPSRPPLSGERIGTTVEPAKKAESPSPLQKAPAAKVSKAEVEGSILRREGDVNRGKTQCPDCGEWFSAEDWPNHKDRLRKVNIKSQTLTALQKYVGIPLIDFLMWFLTTIFFREVAVVGAENIPTEGPVIFYANHQNQFIDGMVLRSTTGRNCRFIIAEKSLHRPVIGMFARMMNAVPVIRPQDVPLVQGTGKLVDMSPDPTTGAANVIRGEGTRFTTHAVGDVLNWVTPSGVKTSAQLFHIDSDTVLHVTTPIAEADRVKVPTVFKYSKRIDQSEMYAEVYSTLGKGEAIAIFPEGGSHDRTSLQPLKAGVALFTLGAAERGIIAKMVPVGLTYFHGDRFRSRVHVEIGKPILPPPDLIELFSTDKRKATGALLQTLDDNLRSVTINVDDWMTLKFLHAFRRLYQPADVVLDNREYLRLTRRLSILLKEHGEEPELMDFRVKVENYMDYCNALLIKDAQAATLAKLKPGSVSLSLLVRRVLMLFVFGLVLVPFGLIALPIGLIASSLSEDHSRTALAQSSVKVKGADVKGSYKIISSFALIPLEFSIISSVVWWYTDLRTAATVLASLPMMMYVSLLISQEFVLEVRATMPLLVSILAKHKQFMKLHDRREKLVRLAGELVNKYDPALQEELLALRAVAQEESAHQLKQPSLFSLRGQRTHVKPGMLSLKKHV